MIINLHWSDVAAGVLRCNKDYFRTFPFCNEELIAFSLTYIDDIDLLKVQTVQYCET